MLHLYIIDYFNQNNSGLTTYVSQLSNQLSKEKRISLHFIFVNARNCSEIVKENDNGIFKYYIPYDLARPLNKKTDNELADYLKEETIGKKRILFHFNWINHAPFAQTLKKKVNCKTVLTKHCIPWRDLITGNYPLFKSLNRRLSDPYSPTYLDHALVREWVSYQFMDHIFCVTRLAQNSLHRFFKFPLERTSIIQNGLDAKRIKGVDKGSLKQKYRFDKDEHIIFFAGTINERKGIFDLIKAFDKLLETLNNIRLVIAGEGDYQGIVKNIKGNWSKVTITGLLDKKTLSDFYRMADVGIVPSYVEQCSYTTIEMMHHGLPIIVANVDGLTELILDGFGIKTPLVLGAKKAFIQPAKLAENILHVLNNSALAKEKALLAKEYASQHLTAKKMAEKTIRVYEQVVDCFEEEPEFEENLMSNPLVSVLLPCHNGEKYLRECVDSILRQTYSNFELIIVDDGSTDETSSILQSYQDTRIIILRNPKKQGIVTSLNRAIIQATGKYIARIDTDDMMREDRLYRQVAYLESVGNEQIAMVGSHHYVIDDTGSIIGLKQYPVSLDEIRSTILFQNPFSHPSVMIRTSVLRKMKYSAKYPHAEDYHLWFKMLKGHNVSNIPECLTYYRVHGKNISNENGKSQRESAADLVCTELSNLNIQHSVSELTTHIAICTGLGERFFNTTEKKVSLNNWLEKILRSQQQRYAYSEMFVKEMKDHIKQFHCGIYKN